MGIDGVEEASTDAGLEAGVVLESDNGWLNWPDLGSTDMAVNLIDNVQWVLADLPGCLFVLKKKV